jgi:LPXTG-motif cell wall-anchored protein
LKSRNLIAIVGTLLVMVAFAPLRASAESAQNHSPDFQKMKAAMNELAQKTGQDFEIAYINSIIPHHQGAIMMAQAVQKDAPHQEVRDSTTRIIADQQKEIDELTKYLKEWYGQDVQPDLRMQMSPEMMNMLMQADPTMREKLFLAMMREHHQSALDIGSLVLQKATHQELKDQAQQMITSQQQEQAMFGGWLQGLYTITPPAPTGDMQDGMDAVMPMAMPAANPAAPAANAPQTLPNTGGDSPQPGWGLLAVGILALLSGGLLLRRAHG